MIRIGEYYAFAFPIYEPDSNRITARRIVLRDRYGCERASFYTGPALPVDYSQAQQHIAAVNAVLQDAEVAA